MKFRDYSQINQATFNTGLTNEFNIINIKPQKENKRMHLDQMEPEEAIQGFKSEMDSEEINLSINEPTPVYSSSIINKKLFLEHLQPKSTSSTSSLLSLNNKNVLATKPANKNNENMLIKSFKKKFELQKCSSTNNILKTNSFAPSFNSRISLSPIENKLNKIDSEMKQEISDEMINKLKSKVTNQEVEEICDDDDEEEVEEEEDEEDEENENLNSHNSSSTSSSSTSSHSTSNSSSVSTSSKNSNEDESETEEANNESCCCCCCCNCSSNELDLTSEVKFSIKTFIYTFNSTHHSINNLSSIITTSKQIK